MGLYEDMYKKTIDDILNSAAAKLHEDAKHIMEMNCYRALHEIKCILEDERLADKECFMKIEEIVRAFEAFGSDAGCRHDF